MQSYAERRGSATRACARGCGRDPRTGGTFAPARRHDRNFYRHCDASRGAMKDILEKLEARRARARVGGGESRIEAQHKRGKLTARERLEIVLRKGPLEGVD